MAEHLLPGKVEWGTPHPEHSLPLLTGWGMASFSSSTPREEGRGWKGRLHLQGAWKSLGPSGRQGLATRLGALVFQLTGQGAQSSLSLEVREKAPVRL